MPWELAFWIPENNEEPEEPGEVFEQLKAAEAVPGLKPLPVETILQAIKETYPELETDDGHRLIFKNGSIRIDWSDQHFRFTSQGNLPQRGRQGLTSILARAGCWMYEEPSGVSWDNQDLLFMMMNAGKDGHLPPSANDILDTVTAALGGEKLPRPGELNLIPATAEDFDTPALMVPDHLEERTAQAERCGYRLVGDFVAPYHDVVLRAWYGKPNIFVVTYLHRLIGLTWEDIVVINADQTAEVWCNYEVDPKVPP